MWTWSCSWNTVTWHVYFNISAGSDNGSILTRWKTKLDISIRMEISTIVLWPPIVISSRLEISIRISTNYRPCLCSSFSNTKLFCIMNSYWPLFSEGSSTQFKTKLALIGFILWHLWESENQHSMSTVVKCQIFGRFIVNVQKALFWRKILFLV